MTKLKLHLRKLLRGNAQSSNNHILEKYYTANTLKPRLVKPVFGLDMYKVLQNSLVTFNSHVPVSKFSASNLRLFEASGVGTCLLTDAKPNLKELFEIDSEVVAYKGIDECVEKAKWLLDHPKECKAIGDAAQRRVLKEHTFDHRADELHSIITEALNNKSKLVAKKSFE